MSYADLREHLRLAAKDNDEFLVFVDLVTQHFEGKQTLNKLPDAARVAVLEWEENNLQ